jgi:exopolysaccharide biosynthesis polyprenyl glycosylphosphotransferase
MGDAALAALFLVGGFLASNIARVPSGWRAFLEMRLTVKNLLLVLAFAATWRIIGSLAGLYDSRGLRPGRAETARVVLAVSIAAAVALIFPLISETRAFGHIAILYYWWGSIAGMLLLRACARAVIKPRPSVVQDVLIVGSGPRAKKLYRELAEEEAAGYRLLGFVDTPEAEVAPEIRSRLLGDLNGLEQLLMRQVVDQVLIALPARSHYAEIQRAIDICEQGGVPAKYLADVFQHRTSGGQWLKGDAFTAVPAGVSPDDPRLILKRSLDLTLGGLALLATLPILALSALAIKLTSPGPLIFAQERYGLNKRRFRMYKLRTMVADAEDRQAVLEDFNEAAGPVFKMKEDPRLTQVGRWLRRTSLDELPQLVNVLRGEMSLVGPRPLPVRDVSRFSEPSLMRRFSVHPGITGLWQVSGRSELPFEQWTELDLNYIDNWSLTLDLRILCQTVPAVLRGTGAM